MNDQTVTGKERSRLTASDEMEDSTKPGTGQDDQNVRFTKARRRTITSRGKSTRLRILNTAIHVLASIGYSATNVQIISDESGVARGSILHQFPTRLDLITGVFEYATSAAQQAMHDYCNSQGDPQKTLENYIDFLRELSSGDNVMAVHEIRYAAHWDSELLSRLGPVRTAFYRGYFANLAILASRAGIRDPDALKGASLLAMIGVTELPKISLSLVGSEMIETIYSELKLSWLSAIRRVEADQFQDDVRADKRDR